MLVPVYVEYNKRPLRISTKINNQTISKSLYKPGTGRTIYQIEEDLENFRKLFEKLLLSGSYLIISDFKSFLKHFKYPLIKDRYWVYDTCQFETDSETLFNIKPKPWMNIAANAAVVYEYLEKNGLYLGYTRVYPEWSYSTFSGRSKTTGINFHGLTQEDFVIGPHNSENDKFVVFDWVAADIRAAAEMSGDQVLLESFNDGDPYTYLHNMLKAGDELTRDECKIAFLKTVNSISLEAELFQIFKGLKKWLFGLSNIISSGGAVESILGREFRSENPRSALNGVMQGSVAHAIQNVVRQVWEMYPAYLLGEIHDSIILQIPERSVSDVIKSILPIMSRPFNGYVESNPFFPTRVSVGSRFKKWRKLFTLTERGIKYA